jgi:NAD(P)-dependent dehydrogenase (short-subunit alcohol dehydrogenase family)
MNEERAQKLALVTGADGGMGRIHVRELAKAGYEVIMACIDTTAAQPVMEEIRKETGGTFHLMRLDLGNLSDIVRFANEVKSRFSSLQVLLNNAGVLPSHSKASVDNIEYTMAVNYLGHFTLTNLLHPIMGQGTRIVSMISLSYFLGKITPDLFTPKTQSEYNRFTAYGSSKLGLYYFMLDASAAWKEEGICFNVSDPFIVSTSIIKMDNKVVDKLCDWLFRPLINTPEQGAATMLTAAIDPQYQGVTGKIFKNRKIAPHKKRYYNNLKDRKMLRDMTLQILSDHNIQL